jgi:predicted nucleic acid-binding protein
LTDRPGGPRRLLCDANVFMYAAGRDHPLRETCLEALRVGARRYTLVTDAEALQEILHRYAAVGRRSEALALVRHAVEAVHQALAVEPADVIAAAEIVAGSDLSARDAVHVAVMRRAGITRILSEDRDFDRVEGIERIAPGAIGG